MKQVLLAARTLPLEVAGRCRALQGRAHDVAGSGGSGRAWRLTAAYHISSTIRLGAVTHLQPRRGTDGGRRSGVSMRASTFAPASRTFSTLTHAAQLYTPLGPALSLWVWSRSLVFAARRPRGSSCAPCHIMLLSGVLVMPGYDCHRPLKAAYRVVRREGDSRSHREARVPQARILP